jgi:translation elongation factor EF-1alpha
LETAKDNKEMGRVLIRRAGETIAAGELAWPSLSQCGSTAQNADV